METNKTFIDSRNNVTHNIYVYALINKCFKRKKVDVASLLKYALPNLFCQLGSGSILVKAGHGRKVLLKLPMLENVC